MHTRNVLAFKMRYGLLCLALICLCVWPLFSGIALRNISLAAGGLASIALIVLNPSHSWRTSVSSVRFLGFFGLWILLQTTLMTIDFGQSINELSSIWLRSTFAALMGVSLGFYCYASKRFSAVIVSAIAGIYLGIYFFGFLDTTEIAHIPFDGFYKSKAAAAYFLLFPFLISCGFIDFHLQSQVRGSFHSRTLLVCAILILLSCIFGAYYSGSLNGLLMMMLGGLILLTRIGLNLSSKTKNIKWLILGSLLFCILFANLFMMYSKKDAKLIHFVEDASLATAIDVYPNWRNEGPASNWVPQAADGHPVNQSTYYRIANFINGFRLIEQHPLGAGFTWLPYGYYMKQLYPNSQSDHTHSGWIDFALGVGIPGLLLLWLAILNTIRLGIQTIRQTHKESEITQLWGYVTVWLIGGIFIAWFFNEVSEREYIEQLFFIIALFSAGNSAQAATIPHP